MERRSDSANRALAAVLRETFPPDVTQAQYDAFLVAFDALAMLAAGSFARDPGRITQGREALAKACATFDEITKVAEKLREVPEAAISPAAERFKTAPVEFTEGGTHERLLRELNGISDRDELERWYASRRGDLDRVVSPALRNVLFDAIRAKKAGL